MSFHAKNTEYNDQTHKSIENLKMLFIKSISRHHSNKVIK
jgi:hypothetical protein